MILSLSVSRQHSAGETLVAFAAWMLREQRHETRSFEGVPSGRIAAAGYPWSGGNQRQSADGTARAVLDLQRRRDENGTGRRQLIEIGQAGKAELAGAVHQRVRRERWLES